MMAYCFTQCSNGCSLGSLPFPRQGNHVQGVYRPASSPHFRSSRVASPDSGLKQLTSRAKSLHSTLSVCFPLIFSLLWKLYPPTLAHLSFFRSLPCLDCSTYPLAPSFFSFHPHCALSTISRHRRIVIIIAFILHSVCFERILAWLWWQKSNYHQFLCLRVFFSVKHWTSLVFFHSTLGLSRIFPFHSTLGLSSFFPLHIGPLSYFFHSTLGLSRIFFHSILGLIVFFSIPHGVSLVFFPFHIGSLVFFFPRGGRKNTSPLSWAFYTVDSGLCMQPAMICVSVYC